MLYCYIIKNGYSARMIAAHTDHKCKKVQRHRRNCSMTTTIENYDYVHVHAKIYAQVRQSNVLRKNTKPL